MKRKSTFLFFTSLLLLTGCGTNNAKSGYNKILETFDHEIENKDAYQKKACIYVKYTADNSLDYYYELTYLFQEEEKQNYFRYNGKNDTLEESDKAIYLMYYDKVCRNSAYGRIGSL